MSTRGGNDSNLTPEKQLPISERGLSGVLLAGALTDDEIDIFLLHSQIGRTRVRPVRIIKIKAVSGIRAELPFCLKDSLPGNQCRGFLLSL